MKFVILSAIALFVTSAHAGVPSIEPIKPASPGQLVCEQLHGSNIDLVDNCVSSYDAFLTEQKYLSVAETVKAKAGSDMNKNAIKKMTEVAADVIKQAAAQSLLVTQGATGPVFAFNSGVSTEWGVICSAALDYSTGDEDPSTISNEYTCEVATSVYIEYAENYCGENPPLGLKHEVLEQKVKFNVKPNGKIIESSISTRQLVENNSCAG